ncbi:MAG: TolC family protein, partial [Planctomycetia bacterium]
MKPDQWKRSTVLTLLMTVLSQGCAAPDRSLQYLLENDSGTSHYRDYANSIDYAVESEESETNPELFRTPRTITTLEEIAERPISLDECVRLALSNAAIVREDQGFLSPGNPLLANPQRVASIYDSAIQDTGFLLGNRGMEAALSDFDPILSSNLQSGRTEDVQNTANIGLNQGDVLTENSTQWQTRLEKAFANSGTFAVENNWTYSRNNQTRLFPSAYTGFLQAEYRQPLLAASGTEFTRIAGPAAQNLRGVSGVSQGVLISRINSDISMLDFEQSVTTMIRDVENKYWDLYLALHLYHSEVMTFRDIVKYSDLLAARAEAQDTVYQSQNRLYEADARIKGSLADVLQAENRLRRLLGLPLNDGEFLKPSDHPSEAKFVPSWDSTLMEALALRPELRKQKWEIRSLELQLRAAKNLNRPRLDLVSQYRVNGFGDTLGTSGDDDDGLTDTGYKNALETLTQGNQQGWGAGVQFSMPLGLRLARAQVRNYELRLRKARRVLQVQEEEVARELNNAVLEMDRWYLLAESGSKRADVAVDYAGTAEERVANDNSRDPVSIGRVLEAKITSRDADQSYLRSIVEYNKAVTELNFRKGGLLQANSVYLAEGEWNPEAYRQATERGDAMTHALENRHVEAVPEPISAGPAPSAWESLETPDRPFIPGAVNSDATGKSNPPVQQVPVPDPQPAPPVPMPVPPVPKKSDLADAQSQLNGPTGADAANSAGPRIPVAASKTAPAAIPASGPINRGR